MRFPYGIADFEKIRQQGYFYQDRTDRIRVVEKMGEQLLLLRPRRFGKSLWLSTLENYYAIDRADQFDALFGDLAIGRKPTERRNQYFVLRWNFSEVAATGAAEQIDQVLPGDLPRWPNSSKPATCRCSTTVIYAGATNWW